MRLGRYVVDEQVFDIERISLAAGHVVLHCCNPAPITATINVNAARQVFAPDGSLVISAPAGTPSLVHVEDGYCQLEQMIDVAEVDGLRRVWR